MSTEYKKIVAPLILEDGTINPASTALTDTIPVAATNGIRVLKDQGVNAVGTYVNALKLATDGEDWWGFPVADMIDYSVIVGAQQDFDVSIAPTNGRQAIDSYDADLLGGPPVPNTWREQYDWVNATASTPTPAYADNYRGLNSLGTNATTSMSVKGIDSGLINEYTGYVRVNDSSTRLQRDATDSAGDIFESYVQLGATTTSLYRDGFDDSGVDTYSTYLQYAKSLTQLVRSGKNTSGASYTSKLEFNEDDIVIRRGGTANEFKLLEIKDDKTNYRVVAGDHQIVNSIAKGNFRYFSAPTIRDNWVENIGLSVPHKDYVNIAPQRIETMGPAVTLLINLARSLYIEVTHSGGIGSMALSPGLYAGATLQDSGATLRPESVTWSITITQDTVPRPVTLAAGQFLTPGGVTPVMTMTAGAKETWEFRTDSDGKHKMIGQYKNWA
jgi:hypothetical protein